MGERMVVFVLVTCRGPEHLPLSLLVFDTIRTGFPTAEIFVYDNASDYGSDEIRRRAFDARADSVKLGRRLEHGDFIADRVAAAKGGYSVVFVDTDMIFWSPCEDIRVPEGKLYAGRLIPEINECGARMPARIHPSMLIVPDARKLSHALSMVPSIGWYFRPFQAFTVVEKSGGTVCWDTCSSLYAALPNAAYAFGSDELDRYDHLFSGTYPDRLDSMGMSQDLAGFIRRSHTVALGPDRQSLRGLWKQQTFGVAPLAPEATWHYWSGVLSDDNGPHFGIMHAAFSMPGIEPFRHTAIVDLEKNVFITRDHAIGDVLLPELPIPTDSRRHDTQDFHVTGHPMVKDASLSIAGVRFDNLSGRLWYDSERRVVKEGAGWRWISIRLDDDQTRVMLYNRSDAPPRYTIQKPPDYVPREVSGSVKVLEISRYESKWLVTVGARTYTIVPVIPDQEIVDQAHGLRYLEALCNVYEETAIVGTAYVEIVPSTQASRVPRPSQDAMRLRWAQGNGEAAALTELFWVATQIADDLVDADTASASTVERRSELMTHLLHILLIRIPSNQFFLAHEQHFAPLFVSCLGIYDASNSWATAEKLETRMFSYVTREAAGRLTELVAYIVGGLDWMRQVVREIHT